MNYEEAREIRDRAEKVTFRELQKINPTTRDMRHFSEVMQLGYGRGLTGGLYGNSIHESSFELVDKLLKRIGK